MPRYRKQEQQYVLVKGEGHVTERLALLQEKYPGISLKPTASCDEP
jgi:hypothetical protein